MLETFNAVFAALPSLELLAHLSIVLLGVTMLLFNHKSVGLIIIVSSAFLLMGMPSPICTKGVVRAGFVIDGQGIYLVTDTSNKPRFCARAWDEDEAAALQKMLDNMTNTPFYIDPSLDDSDDMVFHPLPQPGTPPKVDDRPPAREYGV